jgi:hypothetical protein
MFRELLNIYEYLRVIRAYLRSWTSQAAEPSGVADKSISFFFKHE